MQSVKRHQNRKGVFTIRIKYYLLTASFISIWLIFLCSESSILSGLSELSTLVQNDDSEKVNFETYWQDVIHRETGGKKEYILDDKTRVDILLSEYACEIDWQSKWAEGVGQSIYYAVKTNRKPLVILLARKDGWEKYRNRVEICGIDCWVYDVRIRSWVDQE